MTLRIRHIGVIASASVMIGCAPQSAARSIGPRVGHAVVPLHAPDHQPGWISDQTNWVRNVRHVSSRFVKDIVVLRFRAGTSQVDRQQAIDRIDGTVIGGMPFVGMEGVYYVKIPSDSTNENVFTAIGVLDSMPQIQNALPYLITDDGYAYSSKSDPRKRGQVDGVRSAARAYGKSVTSGVARISLREGAQSKPFSHPLLLLA